MGDRIHEVVSGKVRTWRQEGSNTRCLLSVNLRILVQSVQITSTLSSDSVNTLGAFSPYQIRVIYLLSSDIRSQSVKSSYRPACPKIWNIALFPEVLDASGAD